MTREEAKQWLEAMKSSYALPTETYEALDMAIEALKQVTGKLNNPDDSLLTADSEACKEQKSKLDLISRAEAIEAVRLETGMRGLLGRGDILEILSSLPSADICPYYHHELTGEPFCEMEDRRHGTWKDIDGDGHYWECSACGEVLCCNNNFCPNCGAKMDGERSE